MVAVAVIGGAVISAGAGMVASGNAAHAQTNAANQANQTARDQYAQTRSDLSPFVQAGVGATNDLTSRLGDLSSPFSMTQANLEQTPGYQFNLSQGMRAVNNSMGARGLLNSGAVMKGASSFATGLADSTYGSQFNMDQANKQNAYNKLMGVSQLGEAAAAQTGAYGTQIANQIGQNTIGAGNANAAASIAGANAISGGVNSIANYAMMNQFMPGMMGANNGGIFGGMSGNSLNGIRAGSPMSGGQG